MINKVMNEKTVKKVIKVLWRETIKKIGKGEMASFEATAEVGTTGYCNSSTFN